MSETQGSVIRQFNIYDTSASPPLQRIHEIGAKAENVLIDLGEGQDPISVQDALLGSTSISEGLERIESSNLVIYSDKEHNTISADLDYNLDTLAKANSVLFTLQDYKDSSNKFEPIGAVYVIRNSDNSNKFYTSLKDFNCTITINNDNYSIDNNYRTKTVPQCTYNSVTIEIKSLSLLKYCLRKNNLVIANNTDSIGKNQNFSGKLFDIYYRPILTGKEKRSGKNISLIDLIYPIGSIYITTNEIPPCLLFGGTWKRKEECFLFGATRNWDKEIWFNTATGGRPDTVIPPHTHTIAAQNLVPEAKNTTKGAVPVANHSHTFEYKGDKGKAVSGNNPSGYGAFMRRKNPSAQTGLSTAEAGGHGHTVKIPAHNTQNANNAATNVSQTNMPPFLAVNIWERMA